MLKKYAADLRKARERRNITLSDVSNKTRIHVSLLEKMESGNFTFYNATYVRAFIKQYAKTIGLNPDEVLYNYELAKSGKYTSRPDDTPEPLTVPPPSDEDSGIVFTSGRDLSSSFERTEHSESVTPEPASKKQENGLPERKSFSNSKKIKLETNNAGISAEEESGFRLSASLFKNIGIGLVLILLCLGVYLLVKTIFLQKSGSDVEIVRQNFDDIVKENEKKILGKRSEEEIKDSINKAVYLADSIKKSENDSIILQLRGIGRGAINIYTDTVLTRNLWSERFNEGDSASYTAKNCFLISSKNTKSFILFLNGKQIKIADDNVKFLKITRQGIEK
ncbi:MAG: helix-turn-helix transcriptional regulator [Ignavibacteriae bacterium]|nr:helix-turn-helix transcriptional regulator [Ignavibacteriota bacterium]